MIMKEEKWILEFKKKVDEHQEPLPLGGWERIENTLSASKSAIPLTGKQARKRILNYSLVAAAVLLVVVSGVTMWLLHNSLIEEVTPMIPSKLISKPSELPEINALGTPLNTSHKSLLSIAYTSNSSDSDSKEEPCEKQEQPSIINMVNKEQQEIVPKKEDVASIENTETKEQNISQENKKKKSLNEDTILLGEELNDKKHRRKRISLALAIGNVSKLKNASEEFLLLQDLPDNNIDIEDKDKEEEPDGHLTSVPSNIRTRGVQKKKVKGYEHHQPLTLGVSLRKNIGYNFFVETGLMYSYLSSEVAYFYFNQKAEQRLHYLGIPLRLSWEMVTKKNFTFYLSAGGMMEKCIYGTLDGNKHIEKPLQFSTTASAGIQYNITRMVGLYIEPGIAYYFDNGSDVETIRKDTPCTFTLQGGIRLTY